jgi:NADPH:quinone reductase-like Zn-dependent oxidoreductase
LNYRDILLLENNQQDGRVPLSDGAGVVEVLGDGVRNLNVGDRVTANFFTRWVSGRFSMAYHNTALGGAIDGMLTEYIVLPADALVTFPDTLTFEEAATLPCAGLTAWNALITRGDLQPSDTVLVQGTGGVSIFALQFAMGIGARVIVTSSSDAKLERVRDLGAWETINYKTTPNWEKTVFTLTEKRGVDHIVEVGGPATYEQSLKAVAAGGHIAQIGVLSGFDFHPNIWPITAKNATVSGIYVGSVEQFQKMNHYIVEQGIKPVVDTVFPFEEAPAAYDYMRSGSHFGKIVIHV